MVTKGPWEQRVFFDRPGTSSKSSTASERALAPTGNIRPTNARGRSNISNNGQDDINTDSGACRTCAKAKVRCVRTTASNAQCQRCYRLKRECLVNQDAASRKRKPGSSRVAQLERKLDGLIDMLVVQNDSPSSSNTRTPQSPPETNNEPLHHTATTALPLTPKSNTVCPPSEVNDPFPEFTSGFGPAKTLLDRYRSHLTPHFPFVVIPDAVNPEALRMEKPLLFRAIVVASAYDNLARQRELGKEVIRYLSEQLLVQGNKSLEILQGILVLTNWYHLHLFINQQGTNLVHLAAALIIDLGLNKPPTGRYPPEVVVLKNDFPNGIRTPAPRSSEERRAFLGAFYLFSVLSKSLKILDPLRFSHYMEQCCGELAQEPEYESDIFLINLIRIQRVVDSISQNITHRFDRAWGSNMAPLSLYAQSFHSELERVQRELPPHLEDDVNALMHIHAAEVFLYESVIKNYRETSPYTGPTHPLPVLDLLHSCLTSVRRLFDVFETISPAQYYDLPISTWAFCALGTIAMFKLHSLEAPGWEGSHIRATVDFSSTTERMIAQLAHAQEAAGLPNNEIFTRFARRLQVTKAWFDSSMKERAERGQDAAIGDQAHLEAEIESRMSVQKAGEKVPYASDGPPMFESFEGDFWKDFLGDWDGALDGMGMF